MRYAYSYGFEQFVLEAGQNYPLEPCMALYLPIFIVCLFVLYPREREFSRSGILGATKRNGWAAGRLKTSISRPN
jgi:hypothetical protein